MTTKHTPGPWFCENGDNRWTVWDDEGIACICDVHAGVEPDPSGATHARLIAAAPDLLAALTTMMWCVDAGYAVIKNGVVYDAQTQLAVEAIRAAIAKAKGKGK